MKLTTIQVAEKLKISRPMVLSLIEHGYLQDMSESAGMENRHKRLIESSALNEFARSEVWQQRSGRRTMFNKKGELITRATNGTGPGPGHQMVLRPRHQTAPAPIGGATEKVAAPMGGLRDQLDRIEQKVDRLLKELGVG